MFVTGNSAKAGGPGEFATVGYKTATGARLWAQRYRGPGSSPAQAASVAISPGGGTVIITGTNGRDYSTVAYRAASGTRLWVRHHTGPTGFREYGGATALAVSPGGRTVFVTGRDTVAYRAATGAQLWASPSLGGYYASALAVSPDGRRVFVAGYTAWFIPHRQADRYTIIAYRA